MKVVNISDAGVEKRRANAARLREIADEIESGDIADFVFVANHLKCGAFMVLGAFEDRWRILGALEYAKSTVHENN